MVMERWRPGRGLVPWGPFRELEEMERNFSNFGWPLSPATGTTEKMAEYIAEGIRMSGQQAVVRKISNINVPHDFTGYYGYILGS